MSSYWGPIPTAIVRKNKQVYTGVARKGDTHLVTDPNTGKQYNMPDGDIEQYIGFKKGDKSVEKYVADAFSSANDVKVQKTNGGHILMLEYSETYLILRVTFEKMAKEGNVVVYMNVPSSVAAELLVLARSGATQYSSVDGHMRHVLGMRFWDLIRVRGYVHATRYPFEYVHDSDNYVKGTAAGARNWANTQFVFVDDGHSRQKAVPVEQLTGTDRDAYDARVAMYQNKVKPGSYNIDYLYNVVTKANIEDGPREAVLSAMNAINKGKGSETDKSRSMYNYLKIIGLL